MANYNEAILQSILYPQFKDSVIFTDEQSFNLNEIDVYSYAMIIYTLLTNEYPYKNIPIALSVIFHSNKSIIIHTDFHRFQNLKCCFHSY